MRLPEDLYPYQVEDSEKMASEGNWLNFSEMGTGKTPTTLATIEKVGFKFPLIVCPNSLKFEWVRQISDWVVPNICVVSRQNTYTRLWDIVMSIRDANRYYRIVNYEVFRNTECVQMLSMMPFDVVVFDEVHKIRNMKTKTTKGVYEFLASLKVSPKIICLTGSPIMNYPNDLYVSLSLVDELTYPRTVRHWNLFLYKYCYFSMGRYGPYIYGTRALSKLKEEVSPYIIRRTKKEVLPFLPEKYYRKSFLEMRKDQREIYDQMENELRILLDNGEPLWAPSVLAKITRLRQISLDPRILGVNASSAKTEFLLDLIESTDEKLVVFSCFEGYIELISHHLRERGVSYIVVTGETPPPKRIEEVKKFQEGDTQIFLGTIQTAGEGITLTASSNVVLVDRWWNNPTNEQAVDRLHRIGQKNAVQVVLPILQESTDEILDRVLNRKDEASGQFLSEQRVIQQVLEERFQPGLVREEQ